MAGTHQIFVLIIGMALLAALSVCSGVAYVSGGDAVNAFNRAQRRRGGVVLPSGFRALIRLAFRTSAAELDTDTKRYMRRCRAFSVLTGMAVLAGLAVLLAQV